MKIGILSDTHGLLRPEVTEALAGCDVILHAGDINKQSILDALGNIAPLYAVRGNNDKEWAEHLPLRREIELEGRKVFMTHKRSDIPKDTSGYDLVVFGHSHRYEERREGRTLFLNPGSCGPRRLTQPITLAVAEPGADGFHAEKIDIPHKTGDA